MDQSIRALKDAFSPQKSAVTDNGLLDYLYLIQEKESSSGRYLLHWAADYKLSFALIEKIYELNPSAISSPDNHGNLPLHLALRKKTVNRKVVQFLLDKYPEAVKIKNEHGYYPLHYSVIAENGLDITKRLVENYFEAGNELTSLRGRSILHEAIIAEAPLETLKYILEKYPDLAGRKDKYARLPIYYLLVKEDYLHQPLRRKVTQSDKDKNPGLHGYSYHHKGSDMLYKFICCHRGEHIYDIYEEDGYEDGVINRGVNRDDIINEFATKSINDDIETHQRTSSHVLYSVETKLQHHLDLNSLGSPYHSPMSVKEVLDKLTINQGGKQ